MAVIEIAKIQVRRGDARLTGMPQLDTGEFGWAVAGTQPNSTVPELYIGNNTSTTGVSFNTNTRILTVLDLPNIFASAIATTTTNYTYTGNKALSILVRPVARTLRSKLDDAVSLRDFGVVPDPAIPVTEGLQQAIDDLFLNSDKSQFDARVPLVIPPGDYLITGTIFIPPYTTLEGAGRDKTVFTYTGATGAPMFQFVDQTSTPNNPVTLTNMVSNSIPVAISLTGMTLKYASSTTPNLMQPLVYADCATDVLIDDLRFLNDAATTGTNINHVGISIRGVGALTSENLRITNCLFEKMFYGIRSDYDIEDTVIEGNRFLNCNRGIVYGEFLAPGQQTGPKKSRIIRNVFSNINREGIMVIAANTQTNNVTNHIISENIFENVGNNGVGDLQAQYSPIKLETYGNVSQNDYFSRFEVINNTSTSALFVVPIAGKASIIDNRVRQVVLNSGSATGTLVKLGHTGSITNIKIQYHMTFAGISRWGNLFTVVTQGVVGDITDDYKFVGATDGNVTFTASLDTPTNTISITYFGNSLNGQITYQVNQYY